MKIVKIEDGYAYAEAEGIRKKINIVLVADVKVGDYVMVHAGFAISKFEKEEAEQILKILKEYKNAL